MTLWLNIILAWVAVALSFLLVIIWILRLINKKKKIVLIQRLNRTLRKHHKVIGLFMIFTALIHGLLSSESVFSLNWGTANWVVSILLGLSWLLRKKLNLKKWWMYIHRVLTVAFVSLIVIHIINVGGIIIDDLITGRIQPPSTQTEQTEIFIVDPIPEPTEQTVVPTLPPKDDEIAQTPQPTQTPASTPTETPSNTPVYKDGIYEGTGTGFMPGLVVEVVIEQERIANVTVIDHNEQKERYWGLPVELIPQLIVESQSTDVDTVSGATMTSQGIIEAVNDALSKAIQ